MRHEVYIILQIQFAYTIALAYQQACVVATTTAQTAQSTKSNTLQKAYLQNLLNFFNKDLTVLCVLKLTIVLYMLEQMMAQRKE